jgi:ribosome biogenesis GTPase / thiamine phosphate phosphatase
VDLSALGWNARLSSAFDSLSRGDLVPARVCSDQRHIYTIITALGELAAEVSGRFRAAAGARAEFPVVGDWVAAAPREGEAAATIHAVLPRAGVIARRGAGDSAEEQLIAANVDTVIIVSGLDHDYNLRRLERYLTLAWSSGAQPVIVLNKADACDDAAGRAAEVQSLAPGVPVLTTSARTGEGMGEVAAVLAPGRTAVLVGSSGVGKSTLVNRLLGADLRKTRDVREDDSRGRHTTTRRDLLLLPGGAALIDNPGMREVGLWGGEEDLAGSFADIESLAAGCRFTDCRHAAEPGCAVRSAFEAGSLDPGRYESYQKLRRELAWVEAQASERGRLELKRRSRMLGKLQKNFQKDRW